MSTADVVELANKCSTLMASDVHHIPLFTQKFINKLIDCTYPFIFKMYLLPYMSWFDYSLLKELVIFSNNKEALKMIDQFIHSLDYSKPVTCYHITEVSELFIPLKNSQYALLATVHTKSIDELILQDVLNIKKSLISTLEITDNAIQLSAIHNKSCCFYWMIPVNLQHLIEDKLNKNLLKLCDEEIIFIKLLLVNYSSEDTEYQQNDFNLFHIYLDDSQEVLLTNNYSKYICTFIYTYIHMYIHTYIHTYCTYF